ncbi:MAG TPA: MBL fold metallo-hydrolase [Vicinamibacterales bacterium]|nr:MBL fold metallo-hydrolase [Vicinamibacterales bacterium]
MRRLVLAFAIAFVFAASLVAADSGALTIYFIDVEGGQSTLVVTPSGESLLVDAGFPSDGKFSSTPGDPAKARDAQRVVAAMHDAGVAALDNLLVTHFHADHDGGIPELAKLVTIRRFIDHGRPADDAEKGVPGTEAAFEAYVQARDGAAHLEPTPGTKLPIRGVEAIVVSAAEKTITAPLSGGGAANAACQTPRPAQEKTENPRSTGIRLRYGRFTFLDVGDLSGPPLYALFCPRDLIGPVDVYLLPHHGGVEAGDPAVLGATPPRVGVANNGAVKGGAPEMFATAYDLAPRMDLWQLHRSRNEGAHNGPADRIANLDETTSYWIKVTARADGSFVVVNPRTNGRREYARRR